MVAVRRPSPIIEEKSSLPDVYANRAFLNAGRFVILLYVLSWVTPNFVIAIARMGYLGFGAIWCVMAIGRFKSFPRLCTPVCIAFVIQLWSIFTSIYAYFNIGRPINAGRPDYYLMEDLLPFFVGSMIIRVDPQGWKFFFRSLSIAFGASCVVGAFQFIKFPPALSLAHLYQEKAIDFWDGVPGIRAIGLSWHPNGLAFQALVLVGLVGGKSLLGKPTYKDLGALLFLSATVVMSQARISFFVLAVVWVLLGISLAKQDKKLFVKFVAVAICGLVIALAGAGKRLSYAMQSSSTTKDASYQHRQNVVWAQLDNIYPRFALTGIGPSNGLMNGTGPEDKYVDRGIILESAYRLYLAMYGVPGLVLYILALLTAIYGSVRAALNPMLSEGARRCAAICSVATIYLTINGFSLNTVDNYTLLSFTFLMAGMTTANVFASNPSRIMRLPRRLATQ